MQLSKEVKITQAITVTNGAAGTTDIEGVTLDMSGYDGVLMVVTFGAIVANAVTSIKAQQDSDSAMGSDADLEGTSQTVADDDDEQTFVIDVYKPTERYVRLYVDRATQNATVASATYIQYRASKVPTAAHGSNVNVESFAGPAEGTA